MYAIVETGGKQYKISPGDTINVEKLPAEIGEVVSIDQVLMVSDEEKLRVGTPYLNDAEVKVKVLDHGRGKKIKVFKLKRRKQYRRTQGHRQDFTRIKVESISADQE